MIHMRTLQADDVLHKWQTFSYSHLHENITSRWCTTQMTDFSYSHLQPINMYIKMGHTGS